jgi:pimeloyl-ACP methyl ester carboxylesterase
VGCPCAGRLRRCWGRGSSAGWLLPAHRPPGELVELADGRLLHLQVAGEEHDGPTVLLETGMGGASMAWAWVHPRVAERATVVAYDRAGLGWSDPSPHGPGAEQVVRDLREALALRGLSGPYVLVGHSLGGHYVRAFAAAHPRDVVGLVLVDPSHEDQSAALGMDPGQEAGFMAVLELATRLGITRLYHPADGHLRMLPEPQRSQAFAEQRTVRNVRALRAEFGAIDAVGAQLPGGGALGDLPLRVVIAAGAANDGEQRAVDIMAGLRQQLVELSSNAESVMLADADHVSIVTDPEQAGVVADAILDVVDATLP